MAVCAGHLRAAMFVDYSQIHTSSIFQKLFYALTSLGHEAVMIFFVLSGYLVGGSLLNQKNRFDFFIYGINRLTRLWIVLVPAMLLTIVIDQIIYINHSEVLAGAYAEIWASGPENTTFTREPHVFIANIFFQMIVLTPIFGTNAPTWSLSNEFYYYCLFPAFMLCFGYIGNPEKKVPRILIGSISVIFLCILPKGFAEGFLIFSLGALVSKIKESDFKHHMRGTYSLLIGGGVFLFALLF